MSNTCCVVIACRNTKKCEAAAKDIKHKTKKTVAAMTCDLGSFKSILAFTKAFKSKYERLDSIILNAGLSSGGFSKTVDNLEMLIGTLTALSLPSCTILALIIWISGVNHFGHFLLTEELLPLMKDTASSEGIATIVSVSSFTHYSSYPEGILSMKDMVNEDRFDDTRAYGQSKLANVLFTQELAQRLKEVNILANVVNPGTET